MLCVCRSVSLPQPLLQLLRYTMYMKLENSEPHKLQTWYADRFSMCRWSLLLDGSMGQKRGHFGLVWGGGNSFSQTQSCFSWSCNLSQRQVSCQNQSKTAEWHLKLVSTNINYHVLVLLPYFFEMTVPSMHPLPQMNVALTFICMGSVELWGACGKRKNSKWNSYHNWTSKFVVRLSTDWASWDL